MLALLGMVVVGGFVPATDPSDSGRAIADWYAENTTSIRIGTVLAMIGFSLFVPFGVAIAVQLRRAEHRPLLTYIMIACVAIAVLEGVISCVIWATAAFRPDAIAPDITRALHDLGWMAFLVDVPPFGIWLLRSASPSCATRSGRSRAGWAISTCSPRWRSSRRS